MTPLKSKKMALSMGRWAFGFGYLVLGLWLLVLGLGVLSFWPLPFSLWPLSETKTQSQRPKLKDQRPKAYFAISSNRLFCSSNNFGRRSLSRTSKRRRTSANDNSFLRFT